MGGFTFNGMGWGDSFYPQKDLGKHYCYDCKSIQEFSLMEVKSKVKVLYIPTVSFRTRYAVGCKKCKSGCFIGEDVMKDLLYDRLSIEVAKDQIYFHTVRAAGAGTRQENPTHLAQKMSSDMNNSRQGSDDPGSRKTASGNTAAGAFGQNPPQTKNMSAGVTSGISPSKCRCCGTALKPNQLFCSSCGLRVK